MPLSGEISEKIEFVEVTSPIVYVVVECQFSSVVCTPGNNNNSTLHVQFRDTFPTVVV